jgi:hypothetical protein
MKTLIEKLNFNIDPTELNDYYTELQIGFQDYKWTYQNNQDQIKEMFLDVYAGVDTKKKSGYGWAITTNNLDESVKANIPWYNISKWYDQGIKELPEERRTPMAFGVAKRILDNIPYARCMSLSVFEPGTELIPHRDEPFLLRVHIPIQVNPKSHWLNSDGYSNFEVGNVYLCDTREPHSVHNDGKTDRVHLLFAIHQDYEDEIKKLTGKI